MLCQFSMHRMNLAGREELGMHVWVGHCCKRDQVRICRHRFRSNVDLSSDPSVQSFPMASLSISVAVSSNRCILRITSAHLISSSLLAEGRTVVVLINVPLGLNDVNPMYYKYVIRLSFHVRSTNANKVT
jgi:hypothetical protein